MIRFNGATLAATIDLELEVLEVRKRPRPFRDRAVILVGGERYELPIGTKLKLNLALDWHEARR